MGKLLARMMRARLLLTLFALCGVGKGTLPSKLYLFSNVGRVSVNAKTGAQTWEAVDSPNEDDYRYAQMPQCDKVEKGVYTWESVRLLPGRGLAFLTNTSSDNWYSNTLYCAPTAQDWTTYISSDKAYPLVSHETLGDGTIVSYSDFYLYPLAGGTYKVVADLNAMTVTVTKNVPKTMYLSYSSNTWYSGYLLPSSSYTDGVYKWKNVVVKPHYVFDDENGNYRIISYEDCRLRFVADTITVDSQWGRYFPRLNESYVPTVKNNDLQVPGDSFSIKHYNPLTVSINTATGAVTVDAEDPYFDAEINYYKVYGGIYDITLDMNTGKCVFERQEGTEQMVMNVERYISETELADVPKKANGKDALLADKYKDGEFIWYGIVLPDGEDFVIYKNPIGVKDKSGIGSMDISSYEQKYAVKEPHLGGSLTSPKGSGVYTVKFNPVTEKIALVDEISEMNKDVPDMLYVTGRKDKVSYVLPADKAEDGVYTWNALERSDVYSYLYIAPHSVTGWLFNSLPGFSYSASELKHNVSVSIEKKEAGSSSLEVPGGLRSSSLL